MTLRLDHANLLVRDLDGMIRFLKAALPELRVRGGGGAGAERWVHLGSEQVYFALEQATREPVEAWEPYAGKPGTNHLGLEVDDVAALRERLLAAGYRDTTYPNAHPHRARVYFRDGEGNDWEFVEYRSDAFAQRHDYGHGVLDAALDRVASSDRALANGMTSHAPMVAEALCALGRPDAVTPWLDRYAKQALPAPPPRERITSASWRAALSRPERFSDWCAFFRGELAEAPWADVLARWVARLAPGICADATHGVIRVGHAARSLRVVETPQRLRELAAALASWASTYQELPTRLGDDAGTLAPCDAIARVAVVPPERRVFSGTIVSSLAGLDAWPAFAPVIGLLDVRRTPAVVARELAETFARVYLANAHDVLTSIVFVHGVTSVAALANLLPHLSDDTARSALGYAWQGGAGLYASFGARPEPATDVEPPKEDWDELVERAVGHADEHVIKLAEAARSLDVLAPSPVFSAAAAHAIATLPRAER